jgi:hypothetical protein
MALVRRVGRERLQALKESKHFAALRDREEFKKLLAALEAR